MATDSKTAGGKHTPTPENEPFYDPTTNYNDGDEDQASQPYRWYMIALEWSVAAIGVGCFILLCAVIAIKLGW